MGRVLNQVVRDEWRERFQRQAASGLSVVAFCRREGVSPASYHWWKRTLAVESGQRNPSAPAARNGRRAARRSSALAVPEFRSVPVASSSLGTPATTPATFVQIPLPAHRGSTWIELVLPDGTVVRLPQQNLAALERVLAALLGDRHALPSPEVHRA
jgi:hypothetical protein